jgi:aspartate racemase
MKNNRTIGILGGVGPETTSKVYHSIIDSFKLEGKKKYPSIVIYNLPFPFAIEDEAILQGRNSEKMLPYLLAGAKILERAGADFGILPCNTLHKYMPQIRASVKIPFLSILEETVLELRKMKIKSVGILATETTIREKLYTDILGNNGIDILYPTRAEQDEINKIIVELLKNKKDKSQESKIKSICEALHRRGAKAILLACTDLQIIASKNIGILIVDSTEIIIKASLREFNK